MSKRTRRNHAPEFKAKVALAAVRNEDTLAAQAKRFDVHPGQVTAWKEQLLRAAADVFAEGRHTDPPVNVQMRHAKIGEITLENDSVERALTKADLLSARRCLTGPTDSPSRNRRTRSASAGARSTTSRDCAPRPISR